MDRRDKTGAEDLDFEISFYEDILKDKPDFVDALILLGEVYTRRGLYQKGLNVDKHLITLKPDDPIICYNLACSYSLVGDIDSSLTALHDAVGKGYRDLAYMNTDPDLENTRKDMRFQKFMDEWRESVGGGAHGVWIVQESSTAKAEKGKEKDGYKKRRTGKTAAKKKGSKETKTKRRRAAN